MKLLFKNLSAAILLHAIAPACDIPVFRYALDRWPADAFHLALSEETLSDPAIKNSLDELAKRYDVNLDYGEAEEGQTEPARLLFPDNTGIAWSGTLDPPTFDRILDSPARKRVVDELMAGTSIVWVYVEGGDSATDDKMVKQVTERLDYIHSIAELPEMDPNDPSNTLGPGPDLEIKFAVIRLSPETAEEEQFIDMLRGPEPEDDLAEGGFFVPVFGRGRALAAIPNSLIDDSLVDDACLFLLGACSCEVKDLNPGWDLLFTFDWELGLEAVEESLIKAAHAEGEALAPKVAIPAVETVRIGAGETNPPVGQTTTVAKSFVIDTKFLLTAGFVVFVLTTLGIAVVRRKS